MSVNTRPDVFLSFSAEDIGKNFGAHLYRSLLRAEVQTITGDVARSDTLSSVQESRIAVVVFSKNCVSSGKAMDELVKIRECNGTSGLAVIPVFYNVDKYSLENQLETCAGGFDQLQQTGSTSSQRRAIEEIAGMPGLDLNKFAPRDESVCLHKLVETILSELKIINSIMDRTIPILDWNDIFISFRGQDSRKTFISHLYTAFARAGISTFRDAADISRGQAISEVLEGAIQRTKIAVVVFTKHYADSQWCLNELVWINKRRKSGLLLVPAFYDVNPSVVRCQTKMYAEAFTRHGERMSDKVETWRKALADAADISGYAIQCDNGNEAKFIQKITEVVAEKARSLRNEAKFIQKITEVVAEKARSLRHKLAASCSPQIQYGNEVESVEKIEEEVTEVKLKHNKWSIYSSSSDSASRWNVFLSFRGVDTRKTFVSHLNAEMKHAGIKVFLDDDALRRGYKIKSGLFEAIEESKVVIIVFSKNYATSKWCLDELVKILNRQNTQEPMRQLVFPIFYDVDPRDVEKQEGSFKNAFEVNNRRYPKEMVDIWRAALSEAGTLGGWDLQNSWNGREADLIQDVIAKVLHEITTNSK